MGKRKFKEEEGDRKKLKSDDTTENEPTSETQNVSKNNPKHTTFDIKHFRKDLAGKHGQTVALTQFLQVCLNPDSNIDLIAEYLKCGGNSHEILRQVSQDSKKNLTLATPAFHIFHLIIMKVQSELPHMISITEEACRYFLNNYTSTVEIMISENSGPKHRKIILKLFTSMVTLNPDLGIEILNQAALTPKNLQYILEKPNYKEKDNVRTAFVHFMSSFLVEGHLPLIKALLEKQGLLPLVIPGLIQDEGSAVLMFLNILKKNVIENILVTKSLKLKTFSHNVLHQLFKVYSWKGPPESNYEEVNEFRTEITHLLTEIIKTLFTSHKVGLYFVDAALGTTDNNKNPNLYKALLTLKRPWENKSERQVILDIITHCPDLHRAVVHLLEQSFQPQHSAIWMRAVEFSMDVIRNMSSQNMLPRLKSLSSVQVANFVRYTTLPLPLLKFVQTSVGKTDLTISLHLMKVLACMLTSLKSYMKILKDESSQNASELINKLDYFLPKHLPTPNSMVSLIHEVLKKNNMADEKLEYKLPTVSGTESLITLVDILLLYSDIHPAHFETLEGTLDLKQLLHFSTTLTEGKVSVLKFKIVSLWLVMDSAAVTLQNPMFKNLFQIMLDVYTNDDDNIWVEAKDTIYKFFKTTTIFEADEDEIHVILYTLRNCKINVTVLSDVIEYILQNNILLSDEVRSRTANMEITDENSETNVEKLLDDLMKGSGTDDIYFLGSKVPSPFVTGCIKYIKSNKEAKIILKPFLSIYVAHLLHCNSAPDLTELLIEDFKLDVREYVNSWKTEPALLDDTLVGTDTTIKDISETILNDGNVDLQRFQRYIEDATVEDAEITLFDAPYKLKQVDVDGSCLLSWAKYLTFCAARLAAMGTLGADQARKIEEMLHLIIEMCKKQHKVDICRAIVLSLLNNTHFLKIYSPIDLNKNEAYIFATNFLLHTIHNQKDIVDYLIEHNNVLRAFQHKNYNEIVKALNKAKKRKIDKSDHTIQVLKTIGMKYEDDQKVLNQIFDMDCSCFINEAKEPTLALEILRALIIKYASTEIDLLNETVQKIVNIYSTLLVNKSTVGNLTDLELALIEYFAQKPYQVKTVTKDHFKSFFLANAVRKSTAQLAAAVLSSNNSFCQLFLEEANKPEILSQRELTLPLGLALLNHKSFLAANKGFLVTIYNEYKSGIFKVLEKPHKAGQSYLSSGAFVTKLLVECSDAADCARLFSKTHRFEVAEPTHLGLLQAAFLRLCLQPEQVKKEHLINYLLSVLNTATVALKESKSVDILNELVSNIYKVVVVSEEIDTLQVASKDEFKRVIESAIWQNFCKAALKDCLRMKSAENANSAISPKLLFLLTTLVKLVYPHDHEGIATLFDMVTSHSEFLKLMLSHSSVDIKTRLVEFIYHLVLRNKSVMKSPQIPVYLSAYHASTAPCDRLLLNILHLYESSGLSMHEYKPYLWGDAAARYYAVRRARAASLWARPSPGTVLGLFDKDLLAATIRYNPVDITLDYDYRAPPCVDLTSETPKDYSPQSMIANMIRDGVFEGRAADNESAIRRLVLRCRYAGVEPQPERAGAPGPAVYDPAFVLPLLAAALAPGAAGPGAAARVLRGGALALPVLALASLAAPVRAAACLVLHRFWMLLETETRHKNDRLFLTDFVTLLRRSLAPAPAPAGAAPAAPAPARLPAPAAAHLARALGVCSAPAHALYRPVNNFLIAKQRLDLGAVPDFLALFHDAGPEGEARRLWALAGLRDGVRCFADAAVVFRSMCYKMVMDFYSCALCSRRCGARALAVLAAAAAVPRACAVLLAGHGLLPWLGRAARAAAADRALQLHVVNVVANIIHSTNVNNFAKVSAVARRSGKSALDAAEFRVPKDLELDLLVVLQDASAACAGAGDDELLVFVETFNLFSRKTLKLLSKKTILTLLNSSSSCGAAVVRVLSKAVTSGHGEMLRNQVVKDASGDALCKELTRLVASHLS